MIQGHFSYGYIVLVSGSMVRWPGPREALIHWIGVLTASLDVLGIHASNNGFNGRAIDRYRCSTLLKDEMIICRFYVYETLTHHNFVVFQTTSGHTFKVHLTADLFPDHSLSPISVEIDRTYWKPVRRSVKKCHKESWALKHFVKNKIQKFGSYEVGFNDCRHFARAVSVFLAN